MTIVGHHGYQMTLNRPQSSFPVLSGSSGDVIIDYDVIVDVFVPKQHSTEQKWPNREFRGLKRLNRVKKGWNYSTVPLEQCFSSKFEFHNWWLINFDIQISVKCHTIFRCIYCISSKMMTHFIDNDEYDESFHNKLWFSTRDQDLSGFLIRFIVSRSKEA